MMSSCQFRYCYHFGVAAWLREHMMPEDLTTEAGAGSGQDEGKGRVRLPNKTRIPKLFKF